MILKELKDYINSFPDGAEFRFSLGGPFSWRGIYSEVAFSLSEHLSTKKELLKTINKAYTDTFIGWKGGEYTYSDYTNIHFENDCGEYTDGAYCTKLIAYMENTPECSDAEDRLVKLAFS